MATIEDITRADGESKESVDGRYLAAAIKDGRASEIMDMIREMDEVCAILEIQDIFETPTEAIRKLLQKSSI